MNVLVTDDQIPVVEGILKGVNWKRIGVDRVQGAYSMKDAMEKFREDIYEVALCDIQMPFGSGLELAEWIKERNSQTEIIFLTSHAEFEYAQKAIKLTCFDYLIQPVDYGELEACVGRAVRRVNEGRIAANLIESGENWKKNLGEMTRIFWKENILSRSTPDEIRQGAHQIGIEIDEAHMYLPVLLVLQPGDASSQELERDMGAGEMFAGSLEHINLDCEFYRVDMDTNEVFIALKLISPREYDRLLDRMRLFVNIQKVTYGRSFECYISEPMRVTDIHHHYERLLEMKKNNIMHLSDVFTCDDTGEKGGLYEIDFGGNWVSDFINGDTGRIRTEAEQVIRKLKFEKKLSQKYLFAIFQKLMMSFYAAVEYYHHDIDEILRDEEYDRYYRKAVNPRDEADVLEYLDYIISLNANMEGQPGEGRDIVSEIRAYIDDNLDNELTRDEIAGRFFLSKDYISHIFKDAMGVSLIDYINTEKVNVARHLLKTTNLPIGVVSAKVGYSNFAYFSRVFKKYAGCSPNEYRKKERGQQ